MNIAWIELNCNVFALFLVMILAIRNAITPGNKHNELVKIIVFAENAVREVSFSKGPLEKKSEIFHEMFYRVKDFQSGDVIIPFVTSSNATMNKPPGFRISATF